MSRMSRNARRGAAGRAGRIAFAAMIVVAAVGVSAAPAYAHNYVVSTTPEADSVVTVQPEGISVTTNDNLLDLGGAGTGSAIQVRGPEGAPEPLYYGDGCVTVFGPTAETVAQLGEPGEYTVIWQVVSTDGHPVSDEFTFTWQPDAAQQLADGVTTPPDCGGTAGEGSTDQDDQQADGQATDAADNDASAPTGAGLADVVWIGIALGAVVLAVLGTLLVVLRKRPSPPAGPPAAGGPPPEKRG